MDVIIKIIVLLIIYILLEIVFSSSQWAQLLVLTIPFSCCFSSMTTVKETSSIVMTLKIEAAKRINASLRIQGLADADTDVPREGLG